MSNFRCPPTNALGSVAWVALVLWFFAPCDSEVNGAERAHGALYAINLDKTIERFELKDGNLRVAARHLTHFGVSYSVEVLNVEKPLISINLKNASLRSVLSAIVAECPGYQWEENNGLIRIFPSKAMVNDTPLELLGEKISGFESHGLSITGTIGILRDVTEAKGMNIVPNAAKMSSATLVRSVDDTPIDAKVSVVVTEAKSLRSVLNQIIESDHPAYWEAVALQDGRLAFMGGTLHQHKELTPGYERTLEKRRRHLETIKAKPGIRRRKRGE